VAVLLNWSCAVTVKMNAVPAVAEAGADTLKCVAAAALTTMLLLVPVIDDATVSVTVIVWVPAVTSVAENVPTPFVNVESAGNTVPAPASVVVKCTVPA
jgi:hypothetical protein